MENLWIEDKKFANEHGLIGVDEAGRGCLAGPVVAGAMYLKPKFFLLSWGELNLPRITDSKKMTKEQREKALETLQTLKQADYLDFSQGLANVEEIEHFNILGATRLAMQRAIDKVVGDSLRPEKNSVVQEDLFSHKGAVLKTSLAPILLDGRPMKKFPYRHQGLIGGDGKSMAIAMASIIAKVFRDKLMTSASLEYPYYQWDKNMGYGTVVHREAVKKHGSCILHRQLFLRKIL